MPGQDADVIKGAEINELTSWKESMHSYELMVGDQSWGKSESPIIPRVGDVLVYTANVRLRVSMVEFHYTGSEKGNIRAADFDHVVVTAERE